MYDELLSVKFSVVRQKLNCLDSVDKVKRVFTISRVRGFETLSEDSDIILIYNVMGDTTPIILIERVAIYDGCLEMIKKKLEGFVNTEYYAEIEDYECKRDFIDVVLIRRSLYESLHACT